MENENKSTNDLDLDPDFEIEDLEEEFFEEDAETATSPRAPFNKHFILLGLIILILAVAIIRLFIWNKGVKVEIDPNEDTSQFDVETEDYIMHLDSRYLEGRTDDGVMTILVLGNAPFADDRTQTGIAGQLETLLGDNTKVYNGAFENTLLSCKNSAYDENVPEDAFHLYWLTKSLCLKDFTLLDNLIGDFSAESEHAKDALETLKSVNMDDVDILLIAYDGSDYLNDKIITSPYDLSDIATCSGALGSSLSLLRETYPHIRILVSSPTFACQLADNGDYLPGSTTNTVYKNGFLSDYMVAEKAIAVQNGVTFIDNYYGTITEDNYKEYLSDNIHLNEKGRTLMAQRIVAILAQ